MFNCKSRPWKCKRTAFESSFVWKSFISFFGLRPQADLWKNLKKIYFENPQILCSIATAGPENAKEQHSESILVEKVSFHFLAQGRRRGPAKSSEKNIYWKSTNFMFNSNSRPWKCKRTAFESILVEKVSFHFLALGRRRGPVKSSEKNIFWKSTNFMFNSKSRPWKCKRTAFESSFGWKSFISFFGS